MKQLPWFNRFILLSLALLGLSVTSVNAAIVHIDGSGKLSAASGIDVGGLLYDVEFVDGTCVALFDGCDSNSDSLFTTSVDAASASQALSDQVFLDTFGNLFDTDPALTSGCEKIDLCVVITPYEVIGINNPYVLGQAFENNITNVNDGVGNGPGWDFRILQLMTKLSTRAGHSPSLPSLSPLQSGYSPQGWSVSAV